MRLAALIAPCSPPSCSHTHRDVDGTAADVDAREDHAHKCLRHNLKGRREGGRAQEGLSPCTWMATPPPPQGNLTLPPFPLSPISPPPCPCPAPTCPSSGHSVGSWVSICGANRATLHTAVPPTNPTNTPRSSPTCMRGGGKASERGSLASEEVHHIRNAPQSQLRSQQVHCLAPHQHDLLKPPSPA